MVQRVDCPKLIIIIMIIIIIIIIIICHAQGGFPIIFTIIETILCFFFTRHTCLNVGLRQGCVMSPWLFNVHVDGVVREVNVRVLGAGVAKFEWWQV